MTAFFRLLGVALLFSCLGVSGQAVETQNALQIATATTQDPPTQQVQVLNPGGFFPQQGSCQAGIGSDIQSNRATWACPGATPADNMLIFQYPPAATAVPICVGITNNYTGTGSTPVDETLFVPLNTQYEWNSFVNESPNLPGIVLNYGCQSQSVNTIDVCGKPVAGNLPNAFADDNITYPVPTASGYSLYYKCPVHYTPTDKNGNPLLDANGNPITYDVSQLHMCSQWVPTNPNQNGIACGGGGTATVNFQGTACSAANQPTDVVFVLDASDTMDTVVNAARTTLEQLVTSTFSQRPDINMTVTVLGGSGYTPTQFTSPTQCDGQQGYFGAIYGPAPGTVAGVSAVLNPIVAAGSTPLAATITYSTSFFSGNRNHVMVVMSDGLEECGGDPAAAVKAAEAQHINVQGIRYIHPVGSASSANDYYANTLFAAMSSPAQSGTDQASISAAIQKVVNTLVITSCAPTMNIYTPGQTTGTPLYSIAAGGSAKVNQGTYDVVVNYCTGSKTFPSQVFSGNVTFPFAVSCTTTSQ